MSVLIKKFFILFCLILFSALAEMTIRQYNFHKKELGYMKSLLLSLALFLLPGNIAIHSTESDSSSPSWIEILESDVSLDVERKQDLSLLPLNS